MKFTLRGKSKIGKKRNRKGMVDRFILRNVEQSVQHLTKVHVYRQLRNMNKNYNKVHPRHWYSGSGGVLIIAGVAMNLHARLVYSPM